MGKRELVLIIGFVVAGAVAYQLAAPPAKPGERGFSISQLFHGIRREMNANAASANVTKTGTIALPAAITTVSISTPRIVPVTVIGEARADISYELPVESTGPDEATARTWANRSEIKTDELGSTLVLTLSFPEEGTQNGSLTLHVPSRIATRLENSGRIQVSHVKAVELRNTSGETTISDVAAVTGGHRSGDLSITTVETVDLALVSSRAKLRAISKSVVINARNGECTIAETPAPIEITSTNAELVVNAQKGQIKVNGEGGQLKVLDATTLSVDARRMKVEVDAASAPASEITIVTTDEDLRITFGNDVSAALDAAATSGGDIRGTDFNLQPVKEGRDSRLKATLGKGAAHVVLRNLRGDIVIVQRK